ncbi:MAG: AAA family ATPase, partial [Geobacteraceae bacterium]|nr:AAA family ATPase [Geobacteraceae bacterium]
MSIDLVFNKDLSIITGSNGSGKTTAILLLQAILCPNFKDLISIPFENLELEFIHKGINYVIKVKCVDKKISIKVNSVDEALEINKLKFEEVEFIAFKQKEGMDINDIILK